MELLEGGETIYITCELGKTYKVQYRKLEADCMKKLSWHVFKIGVQIGEEIDGYRMRRAHLEEDFIALQRECEGGMPYKEDIRITRAEQIEAEDVIRWFPNPTASHWGREREEPNVQGRANRQHYRFSSLRYS
jgi:hypothetical protein